MSPLPSEERPVSKREGDSEDEEEIQAWLDNRGWSGTSTLACKEGIPDNTNLNTLRELLDQDRILTLMGASGPPTPDAREEAEGSPLNTLTSALRPPEEATPAQESDSFHAAEEIM